MKVRLPAKEPLIGFFLLCACLATVAFWEAPDSLRFNFSRSSLTRFPSEITEKLKNLKEPVSLTYYVSSRRKMPASMKNLPDEVVSILKEMRRQSGNKISFQLIDPSEDPNVSREMKPMWQIGPFNVKSISRDEYAINLIWSGMVVSYKGQERSIPYIVAEHLPFLAERVLFNIGQIEQKRPPVVAISWDQPSAIFRDTVSGFATVREFNFSKQAIPESSDLLFLQQPRMTPEKAEQIRRFLNDGKNVFISFSPVELKIEAGADGVPMAKVQKINSGMEHLLKDFGVEPEQGLLIEDGSPQGPLAIAVRPAWVDFTDLRLKNSGSMVFTRVSHLAFNPAQAANSGIQAKVLIHSAPSIWSLPASPRALPLNTVLLQKEAMEKRSQKNLALVLKSEKPWAGQLFLFSSESFFSDQSMGRTPPNQMLLRNLFMTYTEENKLLSLKSGRFEKPKIAPLEPGQRFFWRMLAVFVVPGLLLLIPLGRILHRGLRNLRTAVQDQSLIYISVFLPVTSLLILGFVAKGGAGRWDATAGGRNTLSPQVVKAIKGLTDSVIITYVHSPSEEMPMDGKRLVSGVKELLQNLDRLSSGRVSASFEVVSKDIAQESNVQAQLKKKGIRPFTIKTVESDAYIERSVYSGLLFEGSGRKEIVNPLGPDNLNQLEFLVVSALERLRGRPRFRVAFLGEHQMVTPAEAYMEYSQNQLAAPEAADVYSALKDLLQTYGYRVITVQPRSMTDPIETDLILYFQPFLVTDHIKQEVNRHLVSGKNVIFAAQHFDMQQRRYPGRVEGGGVVYWPDPKFPRTEDFLSFYGVELKRQILFDKSRSDTKLEAQMRWGVNMKSAISQSVALPFLVRAIPENFNHDSSITAQLSEQLFISPNRFVKLDNFPSSLRWTNLITTSEKAWELDWRGGFLTPDKMDSKTFFTEKQPLVTLIDGFFPALSSKKLSTREAKMVLIGCSAMFQNANLFHPEFQPKDLIMNAVVDLTHGGNLAELHSRGRSLRRGIGFVDPSMKFLWRFSVVFLPAILFVVYGLYRWLRMIHVKRMYLRELAAVA